jgi:CDP-diacylglycerol--glycerol-3-phosphate 3-phosphatidyltransferase
MSIAESVFLSPVAQSGYPHVQNTFREPPMQPTEAAPAVLERAKPTAVPPPENVATEIWNLPNSLTLFRIFLVPFMVAVLLTKYSNYLGLGIFFVAAITDYFDGYFARKYNKMTRLGALLDPIADKLLMSAAFISLVELGLARAWMIVIIIGREFAVSGLRSIAAQHGVTIAASPLGKTKMVAQVFAIGLLIVGYELGEFRFIGELALWVVMLFALVSGIDYFIKFSRGVLRG